MAKKNSADTAPAQEVENSTPQKADTAQEAAPQETKPTAPPPQIEVHARPITPIGNLVGFASVKFNDAFVVEDFKILQNDKGMFVGMPSKPDKGSNTGYRDTAKPITAEFRTELTGAVVEAYQAAVERIQAKAANLAPPSIKQQLAEGAQQAAKDNAARPAPEKGANKQNAER